LESAKVLVPSAVGFFRPVVLLPTSALVGLSPEQVESLLAHELAHIRRHDYLVNVFQSVVETLLFYHPAVWWVSRRIRVERENCCDDLAVSISGNRLLYARALADMAGLDRCRRELTVAGDGADLTSRIRRVMGVSANVSSRLTSWWAGAILLALLAGVLLALSPVAVVGSAQTDEDQVAAMEKEAAEDDAAEQGVAEEQPAEDDAGSAQPPAEPAFRLIDEFDGELELDWVSLRPEPTHVSLASNPTNM
jgi:beta-lactamase regulating signal transducer with metallopeptidase domain